MMEYEEHAWTFDELNAHLGTEIAEAQPGKYPGLSKEEAAR